MLGLPVGSADVEGNKLGSVEGMTLLLGSTLGEIDGLINLTNHH